MKTDFLRKFFLLIITAYLLLTFTASGQVTVTNPTNTTPNLAATYTSLANAITALNTITAINGPVTITLDPGNPETAPAGGYAIQFTATTTAANNITLEGSANTITAFTPQSVGSITDAIFKLIGADYITIQNFTMQENPANTVNTPAASNNMTEWGIALLRATTTDGAQNNTIQNNTISLNRSYRNSFGIYSNARHAPATPTTAADATALSGSNSGNRVYGNSINNVMMGITFIGTATAAFQDAGNDIGGNSLATGNTITNWGGNTALSSYASNLSGSACIYTNHQTADNISYNTINSGLVGTGVSVPFFSGICKHYSTSPVGTFTSTISYNTITMTSDFSGGVFDCIRSQGMYTALPTATINITNNNLINNSISAVSTSMGFNGIINDSSPGVLNISDNIIRGFNAVSLNTFIAINQNGAAVNSIDINNNKIGDAIAGALTSTVPSIGNLFGIFSGGGSPTAIVNVNNNSMDGFSIVNAGQIYFIHNVPNAAIVNINNNQMGTVTGTLINFSGVQGVGMDVIFNGSLASLSVSIQNNDIRGIVNNLTSTANQNFINCAAPSILSTNISNNTFTNLSINTSNQVTLISRASNMAAGSVATIINNSIVGTFSNTASGNTVSMYTSTNLSVSGSATTINGNNFSNVSLTGGTTFYGIRDTDGASSVNSPNKTISGNTINNITMGSGLFYGLLIDKGPVLGISSNTISNVDSDGITSGIVILTNAGTTSCDISSNTINTLNSTAEEVSGLRSLSTSTAVNIHDNSITGLSSGGSSKKVNGIYIATGQTMNIYDNIINNLTGTGAGPSTVNGIWINNGTTVNIYRNKIHSLLQSGNVSASPAVNGMLFSNGNTITAFNNFVANLNASNADLTDAVRGISVTSTTTTTTYNLYYNSIYLNASSIGTNFGTSGIYHLTNAVTTTASLNMIDNIIVNTSTANGTGLTAAYRRSDPTLNNFANTSDYNLFYSGTPSATNLIYYDGTNSDQTLAAYQARVSTREANSISMMPVFVSSTDLHLTPDNCLLDNKGIPVGGITSDIDADTRSVTVPDIGADEFDAYNTGVLAGIPGNAVCSNKTVVNTGSIYTDASCNLIARVLPSGGTPVSGMINTCVTRDAAQLYFNAEPYVQRHYDIEPALGAATATATITLYFDDAEFALYNTNNSPVWPALPTLAGGGNADPNIANLKVTQFHGIPTGGLPTSTPGNYTGTRILLTPLSVILNGTVWEVTVNVDGFSGFYVHTNVWNAPLPITINYFQGTKQGSNHFLNWKVTCNSTPSLTMTLERSSDALNYSAIHTTSADALRCNQPFDYTDITPLKGMNYYRLKMVDASGKVTFSNIVPLLKAIKGFDIVSIAPNPVTNRNFKLNLASAQTSKIQLNIYDMQGRLVNGRIVSVIEGYNIISVNVDNLASGTYILSGTMGNDDSKLIRFVKQ